MRVGRRTPDPRGFAYALQQERQHSTHSRHILAQATQIGSSGIVAQALAHISQALAHASQQTPIMAPLRPQRVMQTLQNSVQSRQNFIHSAALLLPEAASSAQWA